MLNRKNDIFRILALAAAALLLVAVAVPRKAYARVRLGSICSIYGQKEVKLTGLGLVVGLNGTGDGGRSLPAARALARVLQQMHLPVTSIDELGDAKNIAVVLIDATIPKTGLRRGQKIDCYVSSFMGASSLKGGRLLTAPLQTTDVNDDTVIALASGGIVVEDESNKTTGLISKGAVLEAGYFAPFIDKERGNVITLLLDAAHSSFHTAREVARVVNDDNEFETRGETIARAIEPGVIEVVIPELYADAPVAFIAQVLDVGIDNPHTEARVVVNSKTGTVIVTGEVEISPVVITHENLTVRVGVAPPPPGGESAGSFVPLTQQTTQPTQQLQQLLEALNQLQVPTEDVIEVIRELHTTGKLHAIYDER